MRDMKKTLHDGKTAFGIFSAFADPAAVEIAAGCGVDFICLGTDIGIMQNTLKEKINFSSNILKNNQ